MDTTDQIRQCFTAMNKRLDELLSKVDAADSDGMPELIEQIVLRKFEAMGLLGDVLGRPFIEWSERLRDIDRDLDKADALISQLPASKADMKTLVEEAKKRKEELETFLAPG